MANQPYEILIRGENGEFKGAHVIDKPGDAARAIKPADWPAIVTGINNNAVAKANEADSLRAELDQIKADRQALLDQHKAEKTALNDEKQAILAAKQEELDATKSHLDEVLKPERQRQREALERQLATIQAQIDQLPPA